ncbi:ribonuclease H domain-containing protein [Artemisia annua]|uniref:RBR-type E3 ubiquitin transferase n=1 Tax=Artemisia annua TaxID=35608 RepID=A0A2U1NSJ8_ARTAN|nr:ribonuclease H domain-containing protein [Artemisia annua]
MGITYSYLFEADDLAYQCQIQDIENFELESQSRHILEVSENYEYYKVYCKGVLLGHKTVETLFGEIGVAIFDSNDRQVLKVHKEVSVSRYTEIDVVVELKALIEGLHAADKLGLKRVHIYCYNVSVYRYLMGEVWPTNNMVMKLVDEFNHILRTFADYGLFLVWLSDIKFAYEETAFGKTLVEECTICFNEIERDKMVSVSKCLHTYCLRCLREHVKEKLLQGQLPVCPHENCKSQLQIESCKKFLTPKLYNIMSIRVKEAAIPPTEKVYCPLPNCSELMSKTEVLEYTYELFIDARRTGMRKCIKCHCLFCINCKAPWHKNISCSDYTKKNKSRNEAKLKSLAARNRWRQCSNCKNMVELAGGCYHINCRCGYEFCYACGAEYIQKKQTCKCALWDEANIIYRQLQQQNRRLRN